MALLTREQAEEAVAAVDAEHGNVTAAARRLGVNRETFRCRLRTARSRFQLEPQVAQAERGELDFEPILSGYHLKSTSTQYGKDGEVEREWVRQAKAPGEEFEIPEGHEVRAVSALVDESGRVKQQWLKTASKVGEAEGLVEAIKAAFERYEGRAQPVPPPAWTDADLLTVYPIADQHNGLLAWSAETGESYDLKIGADRLRSTMARLVAQSEPSHNALILNLGDWTHMDDTRNATPRSGHVLDVDGRFFKVQQAGVELMMDCIDLALAKHQHVTVVNIPGNHDPHASVALTLALAAFYRRNSDRVTVVEQVGEFYFHRFGATLIGANHGYRAKPEAMAMTMAVRCREDWGATDYHWFLYGHIHHERAKEVGDVRCESFQTLAAKDAHGAGGGYNSGNSLNSITLHYDEGEIGRHRKNIAPTRLRVRAGSRGASGPVLLAA